MAETARLGLTLLEGGQAQKHVTVNEALSRLDGFSGVAVESRAFGAPPASPEGALYVVATGASGAWAGRDGQFALASNGGWAFARAEPGRRVFARDEGREIVFDGAAWRALGEPFSAGAVTAFRLATVDHVVSAGAASTTAAVIPEKAIVYGVTARVIEPIAGPTRWRLGAGGASGRYGSGYGCEAGAFAHGVTSSPLAYFAPTALLLEAENGAFASGRVRLCVHYVALTPPAAV